MGRLLLVQSPSFDFNLPPAIPNTYVALVLCRYYQGRCSKSSEEAEAENQNADSKEYQRQTLAQMEKVKQLEEELAKEQTRLQAMISHLQVEGLEKAQKNATTTDLFSQPASNNRNLIGKRHFVAFYAFFIFDIPR
jgi:acetyl-CoA carboxylase alpha subunit